MGTVNASIVHPRETFRRAIITNSVQLIVAHNHPSGNPEPSEADLQITRRLKDAGEIIGIGLLDHIVFTSSSYYPFKEHSLI